MSDKLWIYFTATNALHHGEVLEVVVRLEEGISGEELNQDTAYTPDIAGEAPSKIEDNLRGTVMPSRNHGRMIFIVKGRRPEVY